MGATQRAQDAHLPPLLVVVGPTASGKSTLAARLAARLDGEVVSADSVQVYRHFDAGSGKPSLTERNLCPHHLIDIREPGELLEASAWADLALAQIGELHARGKTPVVCGGTFLWIRALLYGLADAPAGSEELRKRHRELENERGRAFLHRQLEQVDPESAARLHENDFVRVSRALEVFELSGRRLSEIQKEHGFASPRFAAKLLALDWPRQEYEARVHARVGQMLAAGWIEEVRALLDAGHGEARAMGSVGYRQVKEWILSAEQSSVMELHQKIDQVTRIFARRQRTWLRDEEVRAVDPQLLTSDHLLDEELARLGPL